MLCGKTLKVEAAENGTGDMAEFAASHAGLTDLLCPPAATA